MHIPNSVVGTTKARTLVISQSFQSEKIQRKRRISRLQVSSSTEEEKASLENKDVNGDDESSESAITFPELGKNGIYHVKNKDQHQAFLQANMDKMIIIKVFAPWCRACKGLSPKFQVLVDDKKYKKLPMLWADLSIQDNKAFVKAIGVLALPTVLFYVNGQLVDNFPCGPSKVPILKRKLVQLVNNNVDAKTLKVKESILSGDEQVELSVKLEEEKKKVVEEKTIELSKPPVTESESLTEKEIDFLRDVPFFKSLSQGDYDTLIKKASIISLKSGSIVMREGKLGSSFYVLLTGEVEICQRTGVEDVLTTPPSYLGTVINRLSTGDFFGERGLITGEPRAASIRVAEDETRCIWWNRVDIPPACILSNPMENNDEAVKSANEKYGVTMAELSLDVITKQIAESVTASQQRGSPNTPNAINGVDNDDDVDSVEASTKIAGSSGEIPKLATTGDDIITLIQRLRLIRLVSRCFNYIISSRVVWGSEGVTRRRSMLVSKLSNTQRIDFTDAFKLVDVTNDNQISLLELKRLMESVGEEKTDEQLAEMISLSSSSSTSISNSSVDDKPISYTDYMGLMAEAEFYYLLRDIFASLDIYDSGFVKASAIERVLMGVRDFISDDRKSIIDVDDKDMLIDYETFSKMLLGTPLE